MPTTVTCNACGAAFSVPDANVGQVLVCTECGAELVVSGARSRERTRRIARRARARHARPQVHVVADSADKAWAHRKIRAAKLCATSVYVCAAAIPGFLLAGWIAAGICGVFSVLIGGVGLARLWALGPGPADADRKPGLVRVAAQMGRTAPAKAWTGIGVGALLVGIPAYVLVSAHTEGRRRDEARDALFAELGQAREAEATLLAVASELDREVLPHLPSAVPGESDAPGGPLPEVEIARRLRAVVERHPHSPVADALLGRPDPPDAPWTVDRAQEPWPTLIRILHAHPAESAAAMVPDAVAALAAALGHEDAKVRRAALEALEALGPGGRGAADAVRALREDPDPSMRHRAESLLQSWRAS